MKPLIPCLAVLLLTGIAKADQAFGYPVKNPLISFSVPDGWEAKAKNASLFVISPDGGDVIVEVMMMEAATDDDDAAVKEAKDTMQDFKNLKLEKSDLSEAKGLVIRQIGGEGEDSSGSARINMTLIKHPDSDHQILFSVISSKETATKYGAAVDGMLNSINAVEKPQPE